MITVKRKIKLSRESHGRRRVSGDADGRGGGTGSIPISPAHGVRDPAGRECPHRRGGRPHELARLGHVTQPRMQILT